MDVTATGRKFAGGLSLWFDENAARLPEFWEPCERRILKLPAGMTEADTALQRHLEEILQRVILHGQDRGELQVAAATAPTLVGSGRLPGPGYVPETPLTGSGARKGGGGNAPSPYGDCGWTTGGRNVARKWAARRWPQDELGCCLAPPNFDDEGWSYADWQHYWGSGTGASPMLSSIIGIRR